MFILSKTNEENKGVFICTGELEVTQYYVFLCGVLTHIEICMDATLCMICVKAPNAIYFLYRQSELYHWDLVTKQPYPH